MNLGGPEILVIIVIAILILGPDKLPNALRMFGRTMGEVRKYQDLAKNEIEKAMNAVDITSDSATKDLAEQNGQTSDVDESPVQAKDTQANSKDKEQDSPTKVQIVAPIIDEDETK